MIRARSVAAIGAATGVVFAGALLLHTTAIPAENSASSAAAAHGAAFDQSSVWRTWKVYCDSCHFGPKARAGLNLEALDLSNLSDNGAAWEKVLRKLRSRE